MPRLQKFRRSLQNAFGLEDAPLTPEDHQLLNKIAAAIVKRQMSLPAILFLNSVSPLNSVGSQAMVFLRPLLAGIIPPNDYDRLTAILDRRHGIAHLVHAIEAAEAAEKDGRK